MKRNNKLTVLTIILGLSLFVNADTNNNLSLSTEPPIDAVEKCENYIHKIDKEIRKVTDSLTQKMASNMIASGDDYKIEKIWGNMMKKISKHHNINQILYAKTQCISDAKKIFKILEKYTININ